MDAYVQVLPFGYKQPERLLMPCVTVPAGAASAGAGARPQSCLAAVAVSAAAGQGQWSAPYQVQHHAGLWGAATRGAGHI